MTGGAYMHPDEGNTSWMDGDVNCRDVDTTVFFPAQGSGHKKDWTAAKAICNGCPAQQPCLEYALRTNQTDGLWGGLTPDQRRKQLSDYRKTHRTCADCRTPIGHRGTGSKRCEPCQAVAARQRQYQWATRKRLESPPR